MKNYFIINCILFLILATGFTFAQDTSGDAAANLFKPTPVLEECKMPVFPEVKGDTIAAMGKVIVLVTVNDKGEVVSSSVKRESPKGFGFGDAVAAVIDDWTYLPAYWNGKPTQYNILETFFFKDGKVNYEPRDSDPPTADTTKKADVKISE